ncbi:Ig-like domain-containing protein [Tropicimonas sp. S265A]|uniref:Ig-like domain-containing protein n=1 Tax=Tropicimonas sp. S265A TaxID=3415134 RepID=UPI003C7C6BCC
MALITEPVGFQAESFVSLHADHAGVFTVPQADQLFGAEFRRSGPDLLLINEGAPTLVLQGYFATATPADILAPNGAVLRGHLVEMLAGPEAPGQYAQAGGGTPASPIGQVETLVGTGTVRRADGTQEALGADTRIFLGDLVETDAGSGVSLTFVDGTMFTLSADARMVIDALIYDPNASDNGATFNLIQGGFVFIAGQIAPSGGIEVSTPTATMGIRGTTVLTNVSTLNGVVIVEVSLLQDRDGSVGEVGLFDLMGVPIADVTTTDVKWIVTSDGSPPQQVVKTAQEQAEDAPLIAQAFLAFDGAAARVAGGGTFVTTGPSLPAPSQDAPGFSPPPQLGIDPQDDTPAAPDAGGTAPPPPPPPRGGSDVLEEGSLRRGSVPEGPLPASAPATEPGSGLLPTFQVTGPEDAPGPGISGQVALPAGALPSFVVVTQPLNGTVTFDPTGAFSYAPTPNFSGPDSFTFQFIGTGGGVQTGTVTVLVQPVNDAPTALDANVQLDEDTVFSGVLPGTDPDGDPLAFAVAQGPQNGTVTLGTGGAFAYTPATDFAGQDSFSYVVTDTSGLTSTGTVTVLVAAVNDPPVLITPPDALDVTLSEDAGVPASGTLVAQDTDPGTTLVWSGSARGTFGEFTVDAASGAWTYQINAPAAQVLDAGDSFVETFTVTVSDAAGASAEQIVSITLTGSNDVPVVRDVVVQTGNGSTISGQLTAFDPDASAVVSFAAGPAGAQNGQVSIAPDGTFAYTPDAGFAGQDSFEYTASDGQGGVAVATVTVLVENSARTGPGGQVITLGIDPPVSEQAIPGPVQISQTAVTAPAVNIAVLLDWSSSVDSTDIASMTANVSQALEAIATRFDGAQTQVDIHLLARGPTGTLQQTFDVQDPALGRALDSFRFLGEAFPLSQSLMAAETFFASEPLGEENFLYIVTPADAADVSAQDTLAAIQNASASGFDVTVEAFIYGNVADADTLAVLSPSPIGLTGPEAISDLATPTPIFEAELVDLSVSVIADGEDRGEVADETSAALVDTGDGVSLDLVGLATLDRLLGSENVVTVAAGFDLDRDAESIELTLFTSQSLDLSGTATGTGSRSVVELTQAGDLTEALGALSASSNIEVVDMDNEQDNTLTLFGFDVLGLSERPDALLEALLGDLPGKAVTVYGDPGDTVTLVSSNSGTFDAAPDAALDDGAGNTLALYNLSDANSVLATVAVDAEVAVALASAQTA